MKKTTVVAVTTGGLLLLGCLSFPFATQSVRSLFGTQTQVSSIDDALPNASVGLMYAQQRAQQKPLLSEISTSTRLSSSAVHPLSVPTVDVIENNLPADELAARRERSEETFRRLQKSFRTREAQQAADPQKKSTQTRGGTGMPLVCEPNQHGTAIIHEPIPFGFVFDPKEYPNGRIELRNVQSVPLVVTVHGDDQVLVNGQPATTGVEYPIDESLEITSPGPVRIHVAPGSAALNSPDGRG